MTTLSDLIARLETAKEGSRELNHEIALATGWRFGDGRPKGLLWRSPDGKVNSDSIPGFTSSLDAALTLVPKNYQWSMTDWRSKSYAQIGATIATAEAVTPALAICIAALKAREAGR